MEKNQKYLGFFIEAIFNFYRGYLHKIY